MFRAVLALNPKTKEPPPPQQPMPPDFLKLVLNTLSTVSVHINGTEIVCTEGKIQEIAEAYQSKLSSSAQVKQASPLRVVRLGTKGAPAETQPVSLDSLAQNLKQLDLCTQPIWIDFNAAEPSVREDGLMRIAMALGIDLTNIAVCASEDPSRVSRRRSDSWWHFCSMAVDVGEDTGSINRGSLLSSSILHAFVKGSILVTIHRGDEYAVERIMADMLQGGFCAQGEPGGTGKAIGSGYLYSVILASMAHRAEELARRVVEDASRKLDDRSVIGSEEQQALAGRISIAINTLQQFCDSYDNDVAEMQTATTLGSEYGFNSTYLAKHSSLVQNIGKWMRSIGGTVDNFYRQWQTAMDLVQNKSAVQLTRLLGALGTPAAVSSLADLPLTSIKGASVAAISAIVGIVIVTLKPRLYGKKIQLG
jgi:hypothetical protein